MSAALQLVDDRAQYDTRQLDILKRTIATGLDDNEFALLVEVSKRTGLDLFARQLYGIKRGGKMTLQTGIDGYRLMAARTGALAGIDDAIYDDESAKHPGRASVTVWRFVQGTRVPFSATARWAEYSQQAGGMWDKMPYLMLAKCAEALALRKAFPAELSGVYTGEEMQQADSEAGYTATTVEATPAPVQRVTRAATAMANASGDQITMQTLYERARGLGYDARAWGDLKKRCGNDPQRIDSALADEQADVDEDADAGGEASLEGQGLFGTRGS